MNWLSRIMCGNVWFLSTFPQYIRGFLSQLLKNSLSFRKGNDISVFVLFEK